MYLVFVWSFAVELGAAVVHDGPAVVQHHPEKQTHLNQVRTLLLQRLNVHFRFFSSGLSYFTVVC